MIGRLVDWPRFRSWKCGLQPVRPPRTPVPNVVVAYPMRLEEK